MKNTRIFDIIKKSGRAICFKIGKEQWISNGAAAYSLVGLPEFTEETLLCMLDQSEDSGFYIDMEAIADIDPYEDKHFDAEISSLIVKWRKCEYAFIQYDINQGFFVNVKYIKEFLNDYGYIFEVRVGSRGVYLNILDGFLPCAAVMPADIIDVGFHNRVGELWDAVKKADVDDRQIEIE